MNLSQKEVFNLKGVGSRGLSSFIDIPKLVHDEYIISFDMH